METEDNTLRDLKRFQDFLCQNFKNNEHFPDCWKVSSVVPVFKNVGERSTAKTYRPVSLLSVVSKVFEKHHLFLISSMVLGPLDQLQIFSQSYLIGLLGPLTDLGLLELWHKAFDRVWHAGLLNKLTS